MFPNFALLFLLNTQQEVLLLRRINTPFCNGFYSLPGGAITLGETARQAAMREGTNSLGIILSIDDLECVHVMHRKCNDPEFFACIFRPRSWQGVLNNLEPERHDDLRWFNLDKLPDNMVPAHRHALEQIKHGIFYSEHGW